MSIADINDARVDAKLAAATLRQDDMIALTFSLGPGIWIL
jgi:hypothetical protein